MPRYCKVCGQKSGRCNHLMVDFGEREEHKEEKKEESGGSGSQK
ncbi:hypothetical protein [Methanolobus psychrotolerans]|nr:hypothetical protein [Methanolobus psychrotolerans]